MLFVTTISAKQFTVVLDAGHGGKDPGAVGKIGQEKNINLNVALKLGKLIQQNHKDVHIVYTLLFEFLIQNMLNVVVQEYYSVLNFQ